MTQTSQTLQALNWRYAVKKFDSEKKIPDETLFKLKESLRLSASSFGLQPWKFLHIQNPALREELVPFAWNQRQVAEASDLFVLCRYANYNESHIDEHIDNMANIRQIDKDSLLGFKNMTVGFIEKLGPEKLDLWMTKQVYIALGTLLTTCAIEGIDSVPMEGFQPQEFDRVLGLDKLNLKSVLLCPVGYRHPEDKYIELPKIRFSQEDVFVNF